MRNGLTQTAGARFSYKMSQIYIPKKISEWPFIQRELCLWWTSRDLTWRQTRRRISRSTRSTTRDKSTCMGRASLPGMKRSLGTWWPRSTGNCLTPKGLTVLTWKHLIPIFQQCTRFCFFKAFADSCGCFHPQLLDQNPEANKLNVSRACNLTSSGGKKA